VRVLAISHQPDAGPGVFAEAVVSAGVTLDAWEIAEGTAPPADPLAYDAVMTFGGSMHADQEDEHRWLGEEKRLLRSLIDRGTPLLGVCLGAQLLAEAAGGGVTRAAGAEIGWFEVEVTGEGAADPLLGSLAPCFEAFEWHLYECRLPPEATVLARTPACVQAFRLRDLAWGIQFHAEVTAADAAAWIAKERPGSELTIDRPALASETSTRIGAFNDLGRGLSRRWLEAVRRTAEA
jgi:GMP synthase-like glutamine amidotransferase